MPDLCQPPSHPIEIAIEPASRADLAGLIVALPMFVERREGCLFQHDRRSRQIILGGPDEAALNALVDDLRNVCAIRIGAPQVAYRETISSRVEVDYTFKKQVRGRGQFARVKLVMEPSDRLSLTSKIVGGVVPDQFVGSVEAGVLQALAAGVWIGARVVGVAVTLIDGAFHDQDSSAEAFETAGRDGCREGLSASGPTILEPVMYVEVSALATYEGAIVGDLRSRRGRIEASRVQSDRIVVEAKVPIANLFGYRADLRLLTDGSGIFSTAFYAFELVPSPEPPNFSGAMALRIA